VVQSKSLLYLFVVIGDLQWAEAFLTDIKGLFWIFLLAFSADETCNVTHGSFLLT
jgi:hypothetical protein